MSECALSDCPNKDETASWPKGMFSIALFLQLIQIQIRIHVGAGHNACHGKKPSDRQAAL
jgi:hypothetical protein